MWPNFTTVGFTEKNVGEEKMNLITLIQQSSEAIVVFILLSFFLQHSLSPPVVHLEQILVSHAFCG